MIQRRDSHDTAPAVELGEAGRLLDDAVDLLARCANDPRELPVEKAAPVLIDGLRALGRPADGGDRYLA